MCRGRAINNITLPSVILMVPSLLKSWEWIFCQTNFNPCWSHLHQNMGAVAPPLPPQSFVWGAAAALAFPAIYEVPWKSWFCVWVPSNQFKTQSNTPLIKSDLSSLQWIPQKTLLLLRPGSKLHIFHVPRSAQTCHTGQPNLVLPQTPHRKGLLGEGQFFCCSVSLPLGFLVCVVVGCLFFFFCKSSWKTVSVQILYPTAQSNFEWVWQVYQIALVLPYHLGLIKKTLIALRWFLWFNFKSSLPLFEIFLYSEWLLTCV